jgi:YVTN family beta-propeller protein
MKRCFCRLSYLWILLATPLAAGTSLIYVANYAGTTIQVIDPATNKVVQVVENVEAPQTVRFSPDGGRLYITKQAENVLEVLDRKTGKRIKSVPLSGWGDDAAVTEDGRLVLVCIGNITGSMNIGALDIIDTTSLEKVKSIPVERGLHDVVVTGDGKYAVGGSSRGHFLAVFDLQSQQIAWKIQFDQGVQTLAIENGPDGSGRRIFLNLWDLNGFAVVDFAKREEVARIEFPDELSRFERHYYRHGVCHGIGIAPDGRTLWADGQPANSLFVYSLPELKLLGHAPLPLLELPGNPPSEAVADWFTFTPDSKTVYVSNAAIHSVSAIDVKTMKEVARIPVGETPHRISTLVLP